MGRGRIMCGTRVNVASLAAIRLAKEPEKKNRGQLMRHSTIAAILTLMLASGCGGLGSRAVVEGAGPDELLKLRAGPGLGYNVILGLPDGTRLIRRDCVTEVGQLWCRVSLANSPAVTGYVSEDYLAGL